MSNSLESIDLNALETVTGGKKYGSNIDSLISELDSMTGAIKDIKNKTSGFGQTEMLMLCMLAMRDRQPANVVVVGRRPRSWW